MAIQIINVGNIVNDGLGDDLRTAFQKVNANFAELLNTSTTTGSNAGTNGAGIFKRKVGANLEFKRLISGSGISISETENQISITNTQPVGFTQVITQFGVIQAASNPILTAQGIGNLRVTSNGSVITVSEVVDTVKLISDFDFGPISGNYSNAIQFLLAGGDYDFGTWDLPSEFDYDAGAI